jgi:hypothetical protein
VRRPDRASAILRTRRPIDRWPRSKRRAGRGNTSVLEAGGKFTGLYDLPAIRAGVIEQVGDRAFTRGFLEIRRCSHRSDGGVRDVRLLKRSANLGGKPKPTGLAWDYRSPGTESPASVPPPKIGPVIARAPRIGPSIERRPVEPRAAEVETEAHRGIPVHQARSHITIRGDGG